MQNQIEPQRISQNTPRSELDIWLRDFLLDVRAANRSEATIGYYEDKLKPFLAFLREQGIENPALIRATHLREFLVYLGGVPWLWGCPRLLAGCTGLCALSGARGRIGTQPAG